MPAILGGRVEIFWNFVKISHFLVKIKVFLQMGGKNEHLITFYSFLQITKPTENHLNSSNFNFLHNLGKNEKRLKMVKTGLIMISPVLISYLSMKMRLTVCLINLIGCVILRWFWSRIGNIWPLLNQLSP